jgi:acyl-CoA synthetase (AMP-forming)/AMP-acid ligase II
MNRETSDPGEDTIVSILARHTALRPKHVIFRWVDKKAQVTSTLTYQELWGKSLAVRTMLLSKGIRRGDRVMISYPFGLEFLAGLIGCMMAGVVGCSVYPPNPQRLQKDLVAFHQKVKDAGAKYALTTASFRRLMMISHLVGSRSEVREKYQRIFFTVCCRRTCLPIFEF